MIFLVYLLTIAITTAKAHGGLTAKDFENARSLSLLAPPPTVPMFNRALFEGDIQLAAGRKIGKGLMGSAIRSDKGHDFKWKNGRVPYIVSDSFGTTQRAIIARAMLDYHEHTCIEFVPKTENDDDYVSIVSENGCWSSVGRQGGKQTVSLQIDGCMYHSTVLHELMHSIGFYHEQSRTDRDDYIEIKWDNIQQGQEHNFEKYPKEHIDALGTAYDYGSVMHYQSTAFSKVPGLETIVPIRNGVRLQGVKLGNDEGFSDKDIDIIKRLYCRDVETRTTERPRSVHPTARPDYSRDKCSTGAPNYNGHCITTNYVKAPFDHDSASSTCSDYGTGTLVSIHSAANDHAVATYAASVGDAEHIWIGLVVSDGEASWTDGSEVDYLPDDLPSPLPDGCGQMNAHRSDGELHYNWSIEPCSKTNKVACCERSVF